MEATEERALFGGAIVANVPPRFIDVSSFREVPDNQEVLVDEKTDESLIVELLSMESVPDSEALGMHFQELASCNDAAGKSQIIQARQLTDIEVPSLPQVFKVALLGQQHISKFREGARNVVNIYMGLIRLPQVQTDILITYNTPQVINPGSSSAAVVDQNAVKNPSAASFVFLELLRSFRVLDWSLFVPEQA